MSDHEDTPSERQHQQFYRFPARLSAFEFPADVGHVEPTSDEPAYPTQDVPMRHAYVFVGTATIFLCHQIMGFMQGHNYEVVLEVELPEEIQRALILNREQTGATHFVATAEGSEHTLPALKAGRLGEFLADVWDYFPLNWGDHWPWTGEPLFGAFPVKVRRVVHYRQIDLNLAARRFEGYVLFGKGDEAHVYHSVVREPDYDHVASLRGPPDWIQPEQLEAAVAIGVPDLAWDADATRCSNPLPDGRHRVLFHGIEEYRDPHGQDPEKRIIVPEYRIGVERTWWFSTRVVNFFPENPCPDLEEIPAPRP